MKTMFSLIISAIGVTSFAQAGPSQPGEFYFSSPTPAKKIARTMQPSGPQCSVTKTEWITMAGRGSGTYAITKLVNCTGQKCCAAQTLPCCATKK